VSNSHVICCGATQFLLKTHVGFFLFSFSLSLSHAQATIAAVDFTDAGGLPPSPPALELRSSTSPKVMNHF
jgi:hypothetical protein